MGSQLVHKIPVIDFSNPDLKPGTPEWDATRIQVREAAEEYGCLVASYNKIPMVLNKAVFQELKELFDLPSETKMRTFVSENPYGQQYFGPTSLHPLPEIIALEDPTKLEKLDNMVNVFWPEGKQSFSKTIQLAAKQMSQLEKIIRRMIVESLGLEKHLDELVNATNYLGALIKFDTPKTKDSELGMKSHKDPSMFVIICQNHVNALEVQGKDGEWIQMKFSSPDSFGILFGETLHAWSNGRLHAANHRVVMSGRETRYALVLDSVFRSGYQVKVPEELVEEEHPLLFNPFDYEGLVKFVMDQVSKGLEASVKAYCGV